MKTNLLAGLAVLWIAQGCATSNLSRLDPFSSYIGKSVPLRQPMVLAETGGLSPADYMMIKVPDEQDGTPMDEPGLLPEVVEKLPAGHHIRLDRVVDRIVGDGERIIAFGSTILPSTGREIKFEYTWGYFWTLDVAPWEPADTPKRRDRAGRRPPHFAYEMFRTPADSPKWGIKIAEEE
jgi:hypothetical protein